MLRTQWDRDQVALSLLCGQMLLALPSHNIKGGNYGVTGWLSQ